MHVILFWHYCDGAVMKSEFKSFSTPDSAAVQAAWKSDETIFVFDTNVLLNLYGYEESTRTDFFRILEKIKERVWVPHQVGLEYHRRRLDVIKNEKKTFREISSELDGISGNIQQKLNSLALGKKFPELNDHLKALIESIKDQVSKCGEKIKEWDSRQADVRSRDEILEQIDAITKGQVGPRPSDQAWLDQIYKEGEYRYTNKIPPGFRDAVKAKGAVEDSVFMFDGLSYERQYGDLIIWKQLIGKLAGGGIKNVIFITDDTKEDWWQIVDSGGLKYIGPSEHLKSEIYREAGVDLFYMYTSSDFLADSSKILHEDIQDSSIEDIKDKNQLYADSLSGASHALDDFSERNARAFWSQVVKNNAAKRNRDMHIIPNRVKSDRRVREGFSEVLIGENQSVSDSIMSSLDSFSKEELYRILELSPDLKMSKWLASYLNSNKARDFDSYRWITSGHGSSPESPKNLKLNDLDGLREFLGEDEWQHFVERNADLNGDSDN